MLVGFLLLIAGLAVRARGPGLWLVLAGVLIFVVGLLWNMRGGSGEASRGGSGGTPAARGARGGYWRDRYITYDPPRSGKRGWFRRRR